MSSRDTISREFLNFLQSPGIDPARKHLSLRATTSSQKREIHGDQRRNPSTMKVCRLCFKRYLVPIDRHSVVSVRQNPRVLKSDGLFFCPKILYHFRCLLQISLTVSDELKDLSIILIHPALIIQVLSLPNI
jgi:hypothetical protein